VTEKGEINEAKNFADVTVEQPAEGIDCISGLTFSPHNVVGTIDGAETYLEEGKIIRTLPASINVTLGVVAETGCKAGTQITVETYEPVIVSGKIAREDSPQGFYLSIN
jgi:hypothetical protein